MTKYERFLGKDWAEQLTSFLSSNEYSVISQKLRDQKTSGLRIAPNLSEIFNAFLECPFYKMHTIILGQDPYPTFTKEGEPVADGLAFSSRTAVICPKSLEYIYNAIDEIDSDNLDLTSTFNLRKWANQGILLLNTSLTVIQGEPNSHTAIWKNFIKFVCKTINEKRSGLGIIFMGAKAQELKSLFTNETYELFECEHPARAAHTGKKWNHNNVFKNLTNFQKENNIEIKW